MPSYKEYSVEQYQQWLSYDFSENFGLSEDTVATWFMSQNGARAVIVSYGVTKANLLSTYIPRLKEAFNGGYFVFLAKTVTEGGGAGNWLNHYASDSAPDGLGCMNADIDFVLDTFDKHFPPAINAPEVGGSYIDDIAGTTDRVYSEVPVGSIGAHFMCSTLAGNAWAFGEQWCLARQGAAPPTVYFGNPYDRIINTIIAFGGDPFTGTPTKPNPDPKPETGDEDKSEGGSDLSGSYKKLAEALIQAFQEAMNTPVYSTSEKESYKNGGIIVTKSFNNMYKVSYNKKLLDMIDTLLTTENADKGDGNGEVDTPPPSETKPPTTNQGNYDLDTMQTLWQWCEERQGQSFDTDLVWGAQCVDLISWLNREYNLGLDTSGTYAKDIYNNALPSDWEKKEGDPSNDANAKEIWNSLPNGCIVWWTNAEAGHVGLKAGDWCLHFGQNLDGTMGGPLRKKDLASWVESGGAGFLGAWVKKN